MIKQFQSFKTKIGILIRFIRLYLPKAGKLVKIINCRKLS